MSKKKRNRRPAATARQAGAAPSPVVDTVLEQDEAAISTPEEDAARATVRSEALDEFVNSAVGHDDSADELPAAEDVMGRLGLDVAAASPAPPVTVAVAESPAPVRLVDNISSLPTWTAHESGDIRGVLIQIAGGRLLLPNATIAEVLSYADPEPADTDREWLLGRFRWRGWQLPLIAFSRLAGIGEERAGLGSKVIVLKALGGDRRIPYFAILTQGFPRLVTVSRSALELDTSDAPLPPGIQALVRLNDEPVLLPDLLQIEAHLQEARAA